MFVQMYFEYSSACGLGKHSGCLLNQLSLQAHSEEQHRQCPDPFAGGTAVGPLRTTAPAVLPRVPASPSCRRTDSSRSLGFAVPGVTASLRGLLKQVLKGISAAGETVVGKLWAPAGEETDLETQLAVSLGKLPTAVPV